LRRHYLKAWSEAAAPLFQLAPRETIDGVAGVVDAFLPGVTTARGVSLQQAMWDFIPAHVSEAVVRSWMHGDVQIRERISIS
jgi:hypothetical protein